MAEGLLGFDRIQHFRPGRQAFFDQIGCLDFTKLAILGLAGSVSAKFVILGLAGSGFWFVSAKFVTLGFFV